MSDPLFPVLLILRYMHILGAIALMGGTIFMRFALRPVVVGLPPETKATVSRAGTQPLGQIRNAGDPVDTVERRHQLGPSRSERIRALFGMAKGYHMLVGVSFCSPCPSFSSPPC